MSLFVCLKNQRVFFANIILVFYDGVFLLYSCYFKCLGMAGSGLLMQYRITDVGQGRVEKFAREISRSRVSMFDQKKGKPLP